MGKILAAVFLLSMIAAVGLTPGCVIETPHEHHHWYRW
jgi:hypothetical protein